jgi:hypothetical protein
VLQRAGCIEGHAVARALRHLSQATCTWDTIEETLSGERKNIFARLSSLLRPRRRLAERDDFIHFFDFPASVRDGLLKAHPHLDDRQQLTAMRALREWFRICLAARGKFVAMPSRIVDDAWHAFILDTEAYSQFCKQAFGRFLHHHPATRNDYAVHMRAGMLRTWRHALALEGQDWRAPGKLPLLFALDRKLDLQGAQQYELNFGATTAAALRRQGASGVSSCGGGFSSVASSDGGSGDSGGSGCGGGGDGGGGGCGGGGD